MASPRPQAPRAPAPLARRPPKDPTEVIKHSWKDVVRRTVREFKEDDLTLLAAALTYYGVLSLFPGMLVLVSILGLLGASTDAAPRGQPRGADARARPRRGHEQHPQPPGRVGAPRASRSCSASSGALWSASGYVGGFMKASNIIYEVEEGRPFWKLRPLQIAVTVLLVLVAAVISLSIVVTGPLAQRVGDVIGLGDTTVTLWNIAKWPVIAIVVSQVIAFLYWVAPNVRQPGYRWISPGGIFAVVLWILASAAFAFYVSQFGSYNKTYGSLTAVIVFLVWLWITNVVILLGAEMNAELERERQIRQGHPPEEEPFLPQREPA
jgi:membrane protein